MRTDGTPGCGRSAAHLLPRGRGDTTGSDGCWGGCPRGFCASPCAPLSLPMLPAAGSGRGCWHRALFAPAPGSAPPLAPACARHGCKHRHHARSFSSSPSQAPAATRPLWAWVPGTAGWGQGWGWGWGWGRGWQVVSSAGCPAQPESARDGSWFQLCPPGAQPLLHAWVTMLGTAGRGTPASRGGRAKQRGWRGAWRGTLPSGGRRGGRGVLGPAGEPPKQAGPQGPHGGSRMGAPLLPPRAVHREPLASLRCPNFGGIQPSPLPTPAH